LQKLNRALCYFAVNDLCCVQLVQCLEAYLLALPPGACGSATGQSIDIIAAVASNSHALGNIEALANANVGQRVGGCVCV
jgi:hypothetical protein